MDTTPLTWRRFVRVAAYARSLSVGRFAALLLVSLFTAGSALAQDAGRGAVEGRVLNVGTGRYLNNARVTVDGTTLEAFTDSFGNYRLDGVPAGEAKVRTIYTGLDDDVATVNVEAGKVARNNVELTSKERYGADKVVQLDTFVVQSQREYEGDALATNEQRYSPSLKVVMSSDSFGTINEGNPGEFLKYLPGITVDYVAADVRTVAVRGFPSNFTNIYWDGMRMTSSASGSSNRVFEFEQVSINNTSRTEVNKVPTPDMPSDSLGGTVNFVSKSAFERKGAQFNYRLYMNANSENFDVKKTPGPGNDKTFKILPNVDFDYTLPINDRFGIVVTGLSSNQFVEQHRWQPTWNFAQAGATPTNPYLQQFQLQDGPKVTNRASIAVTGDWKVTDTQVLSLGIQNNYYHSFFGNRNLNYDVTTNAASTPAGGAALTWGPGFVTSAAGRGSVTQGSSFRDKYGNTFGAKLKYALKTGPWNIDAGVNYMISRSWYRALGDGHFSNIGTTLQGVNQISGTGINGDPSPGISWVVKNAAGGAINERDLANYRLNTLRDDPLEGRATMKEAKLDVERQFDAAFPLAIKIGADVREEMRDNRRYQNDYTYLGADGVANTADDTASAYRDNTYLGIDPYWGSAPIEWVDAYKLADLLKSNPNYFRLGTGTSATGVQAETFRINNSENIMERVTAGYIQGDARFINNKLRIVAGVRYEKTNDEGEGVLSNPDAVWQRNPDGSYVTVGGVRVRRTDAGAVGSMEELRLTRVERGFKSNRSYDGYYPSAHLTYNFTDNILARFSYAKTIGRPDYANIIPNTDINEDDTNPSNPGLITIRNTALKPWTADNYDLSLEFYFKKGGLFSVGGFQKDLTDFWANKGGVLDANLANELGLDSRYVGWAVSTTVNAGDAKITGGEFNLIRPLTFLPGWGRYFTIKVNGTKLELEGSNTTDFRAFISQTANFNIGFSKGRVSSNLTFNYRGRQLGTSTTAPAAQTGAQYDIAGQPSRGFKEYYEPRTYIDLSGEVKLNKSFSIFAGVRNLLNKPQIIQRYNNDSPAYSYTFRQEEFGVSCSVGVKGTF